MSEHLILGIIIVVVVYMCYLETVQQATKKENLSKFLKVEGGKLQLKNESPITADDVEKDKEVTAEQKM